MKGDDESIRLFSFTLLFQTVDSAHIATLCGTVLFFPSSLFARIPHQTVETLP